MDRRTGFLRLLTGLTLLTATQALAQQGPPQEAIQACQGRSAGSSCSFTIPNGSISGTCMQMQGRTFCIPAGGPPGGGQGGRGGGPGGMGGQGQGGGMGMMGAGYTPRQASANTIPTQSRVADTGQVTCFDDKKIIPCPTDPSDPYFGQDANYSGPQDHLTDNGDGTVTDRLTGLTWQQAHNRDRLAFPQAQSACSSLTLGGRNDWRLPNIKELFSISQWQGATGQRPFLDSRYFKIEEPDASILKNDRFASTHNTSMMGQTWSSTVYTGRHMNQDRMKAAFFFNFLDGRIKQAPIVAGAQGLFYRCVSGPEWGDNQFTDNGDGTVTDALTGLMWQQDDSHGTGPWSEALEYCNKMELAGHDDWRLPNVHELQTIVDYSRPQPSIDTKYLRITDQTAWFWSSTTHGESIQSANYVCFGICSSTTGLDYHGAGAQRSDPKSGDPSSWGPMGGQSDEVRIYNYARCVRDAG